ncbi:Hypothetical protein A7982_06157 [Minicystis rosea]|nr:Hypothetical protein A7982_06157 [Minicystis rosea]
MEEKMRLRIIGCLGSLLAISGCAGDPDFVEAPEREALSGGGAIVLRTTDTFSRASIGGWSIAGTAGDQVLTTGGHPSAYLRDSTLQAPAPFLGSNGASAFTGNYASSGSVSLGVDLILFTWTFHPGNGAHVHVALKRTFGTTDTSDDREIWCDTGASVPPANGTWQSYQIALQANATSIPSGCTAYKPGYVVTGAEADQIWTTVMGQVDQVGWSWGYPLSANFFGLIDSGADNVWIER